MESPPGENRSVLPPEGRFGSCPPLNHAQLSGRNDGRPTACGGLSGPGDPTRAQLLRVGT
eukprot:2605805-Prymnesium_polylepis.1